MKESEFQRKLIKKIKKRFPGCIVLKNDATYIQGIPDLLILYYDRWAALECKKDRKSSLRPNQEYYIKRMNMLGFASIIYPENEKDVMEKLERWFLR